MNTSDQTGVIEINEDEVFDILSEGMKSNHDRGEEVASTANTRVAIPRLTPQKTSTVYRSKTMLPEFAADDRDEKIKQQRLMNDIITLEEEVKTLRLANKELSETSRNAQFKQADASMEFKAKLAELQNEITARQGQIESLKIEIRKTEALADIRMKDLVHGNGQLTNEVATLKKTLKDLNEELTEAKQKEKAALANFKTLETSTIQLHNELASKTRMINELRAQYTKSVEQQMQSEKMLKQQQIQSEKDLIQVSEEVQKLQVALVGGEAVQTKLKMQIEMLTQAETQKDNGLAEAYQEITRLKEELNKEKAAKQAVTAELATEKAERQNDLTSYQNRLKKLNTYFVQIEQTKNKFETNLATLSAEIEQGVRLHPLKDYYELTTKEVIRIEIELKKTMTGSPNRKPLERAMEQMIRQREYLKGVIATYEENLTKKQVEVEKLRPQLTLFDTK